MRKLSDGPLILPANSLTASWALGNSIKPPSSALMGKVCGPALLVLWSVTSPAVCQIDIHYAFFGSNNPGYLMGGPEAFDFLLSRI